MNITREWRINVAAPVIDELSRIQKKDTQHGGA